MNPNLPKQMKAVEIARPGGPEVLRPVERPLPVLQPGEVLIRVAAAGVNGPDLMQRKGLYPPPAGASDLLGLEVSGEIAAMSGPAGRWSIGDQVTALTNGGGYAEYCTVDAMHCLPVPKGVALLDAGGLPETFFTVWSNVFDRVKLQAGETLLIQGGTSGIGVTAIQMAKALGAKVIATAGSDEKRLVATGTST